MRELQLQQDHKNRYENPKLTKEVKELIDELLNPHAKGRIPIDKALESPWFGLYITNTEVNKCYVKPSSPSVEGL